MPVLELQGFGLDISGGTDRLYLKDDPGIFISAVKKQGLADKCEMLEVGDKILAVCIFLCLSICSRKFIK